MIKIHQTVCLDFLTSISRNSNHNIYKYTVINHLYHTLDLGIGKGYISIYLETLSTAYRLRIQHSYQYYTAVNLSRLILALKSLKLRFLSNDGNEFHALAPLYNTFCLAFSLFGL